MKVWACRIYEDHEGEEIEYEYLFVSESLARQKKEQLMNQGYEPRFLSVDPVEVAESV
jgi:hypothetical protein